MLSYLEYHFPFSHLAISSSFFDQWRVGRTRPLLYESLRLCLWDSTGFVIILYFTYSLSTSSTSPLGHDSWRAGVSLCILLIFDNLSNESYIALSIVETHDHFVD